MASMNGDLGAPLNALPPADQSSFCFDCTAQTPEYFPWLNSANPHDVDGNGEVSPADALAIINYLNTTGPGPVPGPIPVAGPKVAPYLDPTGDNQVAPDDVLVVLNKLHYLNLMDKINGFHETVIRELLSPPIITEVRLGPGEGPGDMPDDGSLSYSEFLSLFHSVSKKVHDSQFEWGSREDAERAVDELLSKVVNREGGLGFPLLTIEPL